MSADDGFDLVLPNRKIGAHAALAIAERAERMGWGGVWSSEALGPDALSLMTAVAVRVPRIRLGTAIVPISTRSPGVLSMASSTIAQLAPGRFILGLGVSTPAIVGDRHGRPVLRPLAETKTTLHVVRRVLAGETVDSDETPVVKGLRIEAPEVPPKLMLATAGPKMTQLALDDADGLILNFDTPEAAAARAAEIRRRQLHVESVLLIRTCVDPNSDDLVQIKRELASYIRVPVYRAQLEREGVDVASVTDAADLDGSIAALSDSLLNRLAVVGSPDFCVDRLRALRDGGVSPLVLPVGSDESALNRTMEGISRTANWGSS